MTNTSAKLYITYEEPLAGKVFTHKQMYEVYRDMADRAEYPDFTTWINDMLKSGVFEEVNDIPKIDASIIPENDMLGLWEATKEEQTEINDILKDLGF